VAQLSPVSWPDKAQWPDLKVEQWPIERFRDYDLALADELSDTQIKAFRLLANKSRRPMTPNWPGNCRRLTSISA
jgi:hypothetical protein